MSSKALFNVRDFVYRKFEDTELDREPGMVMEIYEFGGEYRYVVGFPGGCERVFYAFELDPAGPRKK